MTQTSGHLPVVLCCAEENEPALAPVVEALNNEGFQPEILPGVELDAGLLGEAVDQNLGAAVYVLCQSEELDKFQLRKLVGLFSARKGPAHKLVTVELDPDYPLDVVTEIMTHAYAFAGVGMKDESGGAGPGASNLRDVVGSSYTGTQEGKGAPPAERRKRPTTSGRRRPHRPSFTRSEHASAAASPVTPASSSVASSPGADQHGAAAQSRPSLEPPPKAVDPDEDTADIPRKQRPERVDITPLETPALESQAAMSTVAEATSSVAWILGGAVVVLLGIVAVLFLRPELLGGGDGASAAGPVAKAPAHNPAKSLSSTAAAADAVEQPAGAASSPSAGRTRDGTGSENAGPKADPPPPPDPSRPGPDEETRISAAIAKGRLRAIDLLIVIPPRRDAEALEWNEAATYCKTRTVDGVGKFRLATAQQLKKVRRARLLRKGSYWSATLSGAEGESVLALDTDLRRLITMGKSEEARALCVRHR